VWWRFTGSTSGVEAHTYIKMNKLSSILFPVKLPGGASIESVMRQAVKLVMRANGVMPQPLTSDEDPVSRNDFTTRLTQSLMNGAGHGLLIKGAAAGGTVTSLYGG
jgi:hypothetical protein